MGRVLPVFLAILFMGGAEQALQAANVAGDPSSRLALESAAPDRAACSSVRAALCLLPAFLNHACQTAAQDLPGYSDRYTGIGSPREILLGSVESSSGVQPAQFLYAASLRQRPPPVA